MRGFLAAGCGAMRALPLVLMLGAASAFAQPEEALSAYSEAESLVRVEQLDEARAALGRAILLAPDWAQPWLLRARLSELKVGDELRLAASRFEPQHDYAGSLALVEAIARDLEKARSLSAPEQPGSAEVATRLSDATRLASGLRRQNTAGREEARLQAEELSRRAAAEAREAKLAAFQKLQVRYEADRVKAKQNRVLGFGFGAAGAATALTSIGLFIGSQAVIGDLKEGRLATGALYPEAAVSAGRLQTGSLLLGILGAGLLGVGTFFLFTNPDPAAPAPVTIRLGLSAGGATVAGSW